MPVEVEVVAGGAVVEVVEGLVEVAGCKQGCSRWELVVMDEVRKEWKRYG